MNVVNNLAKTTILALAAIVAGTRAKADIPRLNSAQFDYKYDMIVLPSAQNLDNDGAVDFTLSDASKFSLGAGVNYGSMLIDSSDGGK